MWQSTPMNFESDDQTDNHIDLRATGRTQDGSALELTDQNNSKYRLRISDHLRSLVNQPRLAAVDDYQENNSVSLKEVQARLRGGESIDSISRTTDWDKDKIERFIGPILQERAYVIAQAKETNIKKDKHSPTLIQAASAQLAPRGVDMNQVEWNTYRQPDGLWYLTLMYPLRPGEDVKGEAVWIFDSGKRSLTAHDDGARWINGEERAPRTAQPTHGIVYESEPPRLVAVKEETTQITVEKIEEVLDESAASDGVTKRIKLPSWDDIMFGKKSE